MKKAGLIVLILILVTAYLSYVPDRSLDDLKAQYCDENSRFIEIDGLDVHYKDEGTGTPVVLIHGTASSLHTWDAWTASLKEEYRVIRLDIPAFGITGPNRENDYSIKSYVQFMDSFMTQMDLDSVYMAGNSLGGRIAWEYSRAYPEKVSKLVLIDAAGLSLEGDPESTFAFKVARTPVLNQLLTKITPKQLHRKSILEVYYEPALVTDELVQRYYDLMLRPGNRQAFIERVKAEMPDNTLEPGQIKCPTLIQWGEYDRWIPVSHAYEFERKIPGASLKIYDNAGHVPMEEIPQETVTDAVEFFNSVLVDTEDQEI